MNKAVTFARCHWWSCGDSQTFTRLYPAIPDPLPRIWTHHDTLRKIIGRHGWVTADAYVRCEQTARWSMYSATAALMLARKLGAKVVECFGCDMTGELSWDNTPEPTANRTESRWAAERIVWEKTRNVLEEEGIEVKWASSTNLTPT